MSENDVIGTGTYIIDGKPVDVVFKWFAVVPAGETLAFPAAARLSDAHNRIQPLQPQLTPFGPPPKCENPWK